MSWKKGKFVNVTKGINDMVRGAKLSIFQPNLNGTMTINRITADSTFWMKLGDDIRITCARRNAAITAKAKLKLLRNGNNFVSQEKYWTMWHVIAINYLDHQLCLNQSYQLDSVHLSVLPFFCVDVFLGLVY